jgi:hypothetical protein
MANKWYFARDSKTYGPYSAGQLRGLAATGQLRPRDAVWKEGMENRVVAAKVKDLFTAAQLRPPAPPAPAADATPPPSPRAAETTPDATPEEIPDDVGLVPLGDSSPAPAEAAARTAPAGPEGETAPDAGQGAAPSPAKAERPRPQQPPNKRRVLGVKGGTLMGQDGTTVRFRKKCQKCGREDTSVTSMQIPPGFVRVNFFCPKCRKSQQVEVHGVNF